MFFAKHKPSLKVYLVSIGLFLLTVSNFILFDVRHQFLMTRSVIHLATGSVPQNPSDAKFKNIGVRLIDRLSYLWVTVKAPLFSDTLFSELLLGCIFVTAVAIIIISKKTKKIAVYLKTDKSLFEFVFFICALLFIFALYMFYPFSLEEHYIQSLNILSILIITLCLDYLRKNKIGRVLVVLFLAMNFFPALLQFKQSYLSGIQYDTTSDGSYLNQRAAADTVFQDARGKQFGYFVYDAPIVTYGMDYLMWWRGSTKYGFVPDSQKHPLTYLIMLPAPAGDLHAHDFWIKYTVRTKGKVLKTMRVKGDIAIMKLAILPNEQPADPNYYQNLIFR